MRLLALSGPDMNPESDDLFSFTCKKMDVRSVLKSKRRMEPARSGIST